MLHPLKKGGCVDQIHKMFTAEQINVLLIPARVEKDIEMHTKRDISTTRMS